MFFISFLFFGQYKDTISGVLLQSAFNGSRMKGMVLLRAIENFSQWFQKILLSNSHDQKMMS